MANLSKVFDLCFINLLFFSFVIELKSKYMLWIIMFTRAMVVDRELEHRVSSQEREVDHQWTRLNTKSFLARTFLDMYFFTLLLSISNTRIISLMGEFTIIMMMKRHLSFNWNNNCRSWTSTPSKFSGKRGGLPMDVLKYQVFPC